MGLARHSQNRDLTALAGSDTITIYYTLNVLPPLSLFLYQ